MIQGTWAYSAPRLLVEGELITGSRVSLRRDLNNKYDRNAVAVFLGRCKIGYLPRALAAACAAYLDKHGEYSGFISRVGKRTKKGNEYPRVYVNLEMDGLDSPLGYEELLQAADLLRGKRGIYMIENTLDKCCYIGSSGDIGNRLHGHLTQLRNGSHSNARIAEGWRTCGPMAFRVRIVEIVEGSGLLERERFHIGRLESFNYGYNQTADGTGSAGYSSAERSRKGLVRVHQRSYQSLSDTEEAHSIERSESPPKASQGCLTMLVFSVLITLAIARQIVV